MREKIALQRLQCVEEIGESKPDSYVGDCNEDHDHKKDAEIGHLFYEPRSKVSTSS